MKHVSLFLLLVLSTTSYAQQWEPLFDGSSFNGWTQQNGQPVTAPGWAVEGGWMHLDRSRGAGGNLLTEEEYGDFELVFEWRLAERANNGIKYRVNDFDGRVLGLEYQIIDDERHPKLSADHKTGSIYDIYDVANSAPLFPAGQANRSRIVVQNNHIEHWLNGHLVARANVGSEQWLARIANSKFRDVEGFGVVPRGRIMITDHKDEVWYRNIFIRRLDESLAANCFPGGQRYEVSTGQATCPASGLYAPRIACRPTPCRRRGIRRR